jgi:hypothetical protein
MSFIVISVQNKLQIKNHKLNYQNKCKQYILIIFIIILYYTISLNSYDAFTVH